MFNINLIREDLDEIKKLAKHKNIDTTLIDNAFKLDIANRELLTKIEQLNNQKNVLSGSISKLMVNKNDHHQEIEKLKNDVIKIKSDLDEMKAKQEIISSDLHTILLSIPNLCDYSVPIGKDETSNKVVDVIGEIPKFSFNPKPHWELAESLNLIDFEKSSEIYGSRYIIYTNKGAKLYRALIQYTLDNNTNAGFMEILPPVLLQEKNLYASGQLPKFKQDLYSIDNSSQYLSPTAEVQLLNMHANQILDPNDLPIRYTANTCCFRSEAGSAGRDTRGVIRQHQFMKSELFSFTTPEDSWYELDKLLETAENILKTLELPYRRLLLCTGDTGFSSAKTYDLEVYLPSYNDYKEISSCSNCLDFQSRRAKIRYKVDDKIIYPHTLNGSSLAIDRLWAAIIENHQQPDGTIKIPKALVKYMNHEEVIK